MECTIECNKKQLQLIQRALDFYSRVGIGQFTEIKNHPTFENHLYKVCAPDKTPEVGDRTPQGVILEIKDGKALINGSVDISYGKLKVSFRMWDPFSEKQVGGAVFEVKTDRG